jgi:hypothetical protein
VNFIRPNFPVAAVALGIAAIGMSACSDTILVRPPDAVPPTRVQAVIEVESDHPTEPLIVDFGQVYAGEMREKEVTIRNLGTDALQLQDLILPGVGNFEITNEGEYDIVLAPEASTIVVISYSPVRDETLSGTMQVASNDRENPLVSVTLLAEGLAPAINIDPPSFDFGNREIGCVGQVDVTITNVGRAPLTISDLYYEDFAGSEELTLLHNVSPGTVLNPTDQVQAQVTYVPVDVNPDSGQIVVLSDDPSSPEAYSQQFGSASLGESNRDEYLQEGNNATDILFVVDNSCSMSDEQSALAVNFSSFLQIVDALDVDYHLGVATTDLGDTGQLQGTTRYISPNTPDPAGTFSANVNLGINGSGIEQGFHSAYLALSSPNIDPGGFNDGFMRDDAGLRIIQVSDENEQSGSASGSLGGPTNYVAYWQSLKANPDHVVVSDISGGLTGCSGAGGSASTGADFVTATTMTGGVSASICDPNWVATLSALAWLSQSFADTFELSQTPVEDTIEVRLNTVPVFVGWTFDSALNAIVFDAEHVPENGDLIEIEYTVLGDCQD